jgi:DNA-binding response OmpR family regulator
MQPRSSKSKRILSISYDPHLIRTRQVLLEQAGFEVTSVSDMGQARKACTTSDSRFDLVILGHSVPPEDKKGIIDRIKENSDAPILALLRPNELPVEGATASVESMDVKLFMATVRQMLDAT